MIKPNKMRVAIALYLQSGFLPWGVDFRDCRGGPNNLSLVPRSHGLRRDEWILCCGHFFSNAEGEQWIAEGLGAEGPLDKHGRRTMIAGPGLSPWLADAWENLIARTWTRT